MLLRRFALAVLAAGVLVVLGAGGGGAVTVEGITPGSVTLTLGKGSSATIDSSLHLDAAPPQADILLALDTTGSMGSAITDAQNDANAIVDDIKASIPNARFAVADFKDYPTSPLGDSGDYPWRVDQDFTANTGTVPCTLIDTVQLSPIACALAGLSASGGNDGPEAYNRAFYESYSDLHLSWAPGAPRFLIILGDSVPHDTQIATDFPACPNTSVTDPGSSFSVNDISYPDVGPLHTQPLLAALKDHHTNVSFVTYNPTTGTSACHGQLAEFTGGTAVQRSNTASLKTQIVNLINQAASHIDNVDLEVHRTDEHPGPEPTVTVNPPKLGPLTTPSDSTFQVTVSVADNTPIGDFGFAIEAVADGAHRGHQEITVHVTNQTVSGLALSADEPSVPAGIASAPFGSIPGSRLAALTPDVGSTAAGSIAAGSIAAGSIAAGSIAAGSIAAGSIAAGSIAAGSIAAGSIAAGSIGFGATAAGSIAAGSIPSGGTALKRVLLSQVPLVGTTWAVILRESAFATQPLQAVTLYDVANYSTRGSDGKTPWERLMELPLRQVPFFQTLWRGVPFAAILLGNQTIGQLPPPKKPDGSGFYSSWSAALLDNGGSTTGVSDTNTVFGLAISGNLGTTSVGSIAAGSIAAGSIAAGSIAAGSIAAGSIAAGSIDLRATTLGPVPLANVTPGVVNCGGSFNCSGKTLGDASAANAILSGVTLATLLDHLTAPYNKSITIDSIAQGILAVSEYPWEQIALQGLQDVVGTGQNVHYHVDFDLVCAAAPTLSSVHVKLPKGFFAAAGSSKFSYDGGPPLTASDPVDNGNGPVWTSPPGTPCTGTDTRHVRLDFTSYAGLSLGSQSSSVDVVAGGTYSASDQASVLVTQNFEPSDNADTAPTIDKNTLAVGHIASSADVDFYRFPLTGLAPGTKVIAYLKVPRDADLDLVVNKPGAPGVQSSASGSIAAGSIAAGSIAAGSIAAGSIPLEDVTPGVDNSRGALQPDAAADLAAGSIASGSIAAGSISANRGAVNEVTQIVTRGESGAAVIGVSGYNGAWSNDNYVLRVKVIAPPTLPACPAVTGLGTAAPGTLPAVPTSSDANVKALFLVNRQRLVGLYGQTITDTLLGASSPLNAVATQVGGKVLPVDGDATVRGAYSTWDSNPCSLDAANGVVRSINNLVAKYRAKYPSLKYVVLLGTDTALPMWRQQDLTATSPEIDEANDLAFTTYDAATNQALAKGNAIYAAAAQNAYLTDQAYGAFKERVWLGHDIPLADISVSRLVETPDDILGQLNQYLSASHLNPTSALTTGDSFFSDGAENASGSLATQLGLTTGSNATLLPPTQWTRQDVLDAFFGNSTIPSVGALWAHYSHWVAQPASITPAGLAGLLTSADVGSMPGRLLFTVGCHSGLNVPDTITTVAPTDQQRLKDWAQAYMAARAAVYIGNTGFGYGDTDVSDLSERLMDHFAANINSGGSIGEQWVRALHRYYSEPSNYDVIDEKVMIEANMYGLPFYDFNTSGGSHNPPPAVTPPSHAVESGVDTAHLDPITANVQAQSVSGGRSLFVVSGHPDRSTDTTTPGIPLTYGTLSVFYRPAQPTVSRDVTINDPSKVAHGAWIRSLATHTITNVKPVKPFPLVHSTDDLPAKDYPNIFFPANIVTVNRDASFGQEHDTAVVSLGKFFPNDTGDLGTEQVVDSIGIDIGYSSSTDVTPPQITQVGAVKVGDGTFTAFVRVSDASALSRVAVLYTTGNGVWTVQPLDNAGGGLWTKTFSAGSGVSEIRLDAEAQDTAGNVGYSFNKAVNFSSVVDTTDPSLLVSQPLPSSTYTLNQQVITSFNCSDLGGTASCTGATDGGSPIQSGGLLDTSRVGLHTFVVTGTDLAGHTKTKSVVYRVLFGFAGFRPPVDKPPTLNLDNAGRTIPVKWGLTTAGGATYANLDAVQAIWSAPLRCPSATTDPVSGDLPIGLSGLKISGSDFQFNWATDKAWAGTCRRLYIRLSDGTTPYADFQFK